MAAARKKVEFIPAATLAPAIIPVLVYVVTSSSDVVGVFSNQRKAVRVARKHPGRSVQTWLVDPGQA